MSARRVLYTCVNLHCTCSMLYFCNLFPRYRFFKNVDKLYATTVSISTAALCILPYRCQLFRYLIPRQTVQKRNKYAIFSIIMYSFISGREFHFFIQTDLYFPNKAHFPAFQLFYINAPIGNVSPLAIAEYLSANALAKRKMKIL